MKKHEFQARADVKLDEAKRALDNMNARVEQATGGAKTVYRDQVAALQKHYDEMRVKAAAVRDAADDKWEEVASDFAAGWDEWSGRAEQAFENPRVRKFTIGSLVVAGVGAIIALLVYGVVSRRR